MPGVAGAISLRCMLDAMLIVLAAAAIGVGLLALGVWRVDWREKRPVIDVTPARRPDANSAPDAGGENAPQR
jgi:hypothetical protein